MSCSNRIITSENINRDILVGPHESSTRIDRDSTFEVCAINFTCGITTPRIDGDLILGVSTILEELNVDKLCAPIGYPGDCDPTHTEDMFCISGSLKLLDYSDDIGLNLTPDTQIADGFQLIDNWLRTFLVAQPPEFCFEDRISCELGIEGGSADLWSVEWKLPPRRCIGFLNVEVPVINNVIIDLVKTSDNPNCDFVNAISITAAPNVEKFEAYIDDENGTLTSGEVGTDYRYYTVEPGVEYDIRVYGKNFNCDEEFNYMIEKELCTLSTGVPSEPLNLMCVSADVEEIVISWDKPLDHNDEFPGDNETPILEQYQISGSAISSIRYGGVIAHNVLFETGSTNTTETIGNNNPGLDVPLNPGTTYEFNIRAKNVINSTGGDNNDGYGALSDTIQCTTDIPPPPNELSTISLNNTDTLTYSGGGCKLDATVSYDFIYNYNLLDKNNSNQQIRTEPVTEIRNNLLPGNDALMTSTINAYSGLSASFLTNKVTQDLDGFPNSVAVLTKYDSNDITGLQIDVDGDFYTTTDFTGFWKAWSGYAIAYDLGVTSEDTSSVFYANWEREYKILLEQEHNDDGTPLGYTGPHTNTPSELLFVIDDINNVPTLSDCGIYDNPGSQVEYVTGIPTFDEEACFDFRFTITDIARKFLRMDKKHATVELRLSDNTKVSQTLTIDFNDIGSSHKYYTAPGAATGQNSYELSNQLHNTNGLILAEDPGDIQFRDFQICFDDNLVEDLCDEDIRLRITPCNLFGEASSDDCRFLDKDTGDSKLLRIDSCSLVCLAGLDDTYDTLGLLVSSGTGQYPDLGTDSSGAVVETDQSTYAGIYAYNHELDLISDLPEQLALYQSLWQNPPATDFTQFYFPTGVVAPNLSGVSTNGDYRYVTFMYRRTVSQFDPNNQGNTTQSKVRLIINNPSGLAVDYSSPGLANHRLYLKIDGYGTSGLPTYSGNPGDGDPSNFDTYWLSCTDAIEDNGIFNGVQSNNAVNGGIFPGDGVPCLDASTSESQSVSATSGEVRNCNIPTVTTADAIFFVRIGWPNNVDYNFECGIELHVIEGNFDSPANDNPLGL